MNVDHGVPRIGVAQQRLENGQFRAVVEQVGSEAVAKGVRVNSLGDAGASACLAAQMPDGFLRDRLVGAACLPAREELVVAWLDGPVVNPKLLVKLQAERHFAVL